MLRMRGLFLSLTMDAWGGTVSERPLENRPNAIERVRLPLSWKSTSLGF